MNEPDETAADRELLPDGVPAFDDPAYDDLRTDLAALAGTGPIPVDVATRLDGVLAGLAGTALAPDLSAADAGDVPAVTPLPTRNRSRTGQRLLAAAAVVVVVGAGGAGLTKVLHDQSGPTHADSTTAAGSAGKSAETFAPAAIPPTAGSGLAALAAPQRLSSSRFATQAAALLRTHSVLDDQLSSLTSRAAQATPGTAAAPLAPAPSPAPGALGGAARSPKAVESDGVTSQGYSTVKGQDATVCAPSIAGAQTIPILLDGKPAVLVVYPAVAGERLVQARDCSGKTVLASAQVPS